MSGQRLRGDAGARRLRWRLVATDATGLSLAWLLAVLAEGEPARWPLFGVLVVALALALIASQQLYLARACEIRSVEVVHLGRVAVASFASSVIASRLFGFDAHVRLLVADAALSFVILVVGRGLYRSRLRRLRSQGRCSRSVALIGMNDEGQRLLQLVVSQPELGYRVEGVIGRPEQRSTAIGVPWLGDTTDAVCAVRRAGVSGVIIAVTAIGADDPNTLIGELLRAGVHVQMSTGLFRVDHRRIRSVPLAHAPMNYIEPAVLSRWQLRVKRALDITLAGVVIALTAPMLAATALAIRVSNGSPILHRQRRIGQDGRPFTLLKFRTMVPNAEERLADLREKNERTDGPLFKLSSDPRVTRLGRVLRDLGIDELPQLFNVLRGEMSLVGPRPPLPQEAELFDSELLDRFRMPPGITGLWQLEALNNPSFHAYRHLDLVYVENWTLGFDIAILIGTVELLAGRMSAAIHHAMRRNRRPTPGTVPPAVDLRSRTPLVDVVPAVEVSPTAG